MKTRSTLTKLLAIAVMISALAAVWIARPASQVHALADSEFGTSALGVARGQSARLNIVNRGQTRGIIIDWKFLDSAGNTLDESREPITVSPGQIFSADFFADGHNASRDGFGRIQLRAVVTALGGPDTKRNLLISVEVFDNATGMTTLFCSNNL
jgi:hypothetical protein